MFIKSVHDEDFEKFPYKSNMYCQI